ncbi:hypothetical protein F8G81_21575 [Arthrobacter sp. CDRTa11]|uniref:hypothetical protein n=1 Tax=Arthrobacter sp. CDRTa11 TaxID=2651199 RepID=UPI002265806C|nr:hypothetical protein [Arthrobacter sp. CDRTa11]UZX04897.1 hypothetical protein F8G81_21575 [Arthrobacter sp. CDRTa11]
MTTAGRRLMMTFLQRRGFQRTWLQRGFLIAVVLAIAAGIFGMHVMTGGNHAGHSPTVAPAPAAAAKSTADTHDTADIHPGAHGAAHDTATGSEFQHSSLSEPQSYTYSTECTCQTECSGAHAMGMECVPSAKTGSLAAPHPGTAALAFNTGHGSSSTPTAAYGYLPEGPSPGELSISRT